MSKANRYEDFDDELEFEESEGSSIDFGAIFRKLYAKKLLFIISFFVTLVVVVPLLLTIPRFYAVEVKLAPEFSSMNSSTSTGGLSSIMKSFGIGSNMNNSGDAIMPNLYPDLMNSTSFMLSLFNIPIETKDAAIKTTYAEYLAKHQKVSIMTQAMGAVMSLIPKADEDETTKTKPDTTTKANTKKETSKQVTTSALTKAQTAILKKISSSVICDVDKKTGVITIDVIDQDPIVCATIADSTCQRLQEFITEYRVKKSRMELANAQKQYNKAKEDYEIAKGKVEAFNDGNWDLIDEDLIIQKQALQNDMQMKFSNMSTFNNQLLSARNKYESMQPVFTILDGATVPLKPSGPSRIKYLIVWLFLVLGVEVAWVLFKDTAKEKLVSLKQAPEDQSTADL